MKKCERSTRIILVTLLCSLTSGFYSLAIADNFPSRYIDLVFPWAPGSTLEMAFSPVKDKAAKILGQPLVWNYKPGAGGATAAGYVANARPDGHTLLFANTTTLITTPLSSKVGYSMHDFTPVFLIARTPSFFFVKYESPYRTMLDFIEAAKMKKLTFGFFGLYGAPHLTMMNLENTAGFKTTYIPHKEGTPAVFVAIMGGHVDIGGGVLPLTMVGPQKTRPLVINAPERWKLFPNVPTLLELGIGYSKENITSGVTQWLWAPKKTPKEDIHKIYNAFKKVFEENGPEIEKTYEKFDLRLNFLDPEQTEKYSQGEYEFLKKSLERLGVTPK